MVIWGLATFLALFSVATHDSRLTCQALIICFEGLSLLLALLGNEGDLAFDWLLARC